MGQPPLEGDRCVDGMLTASGQVPLRPALIISLAQFYDAPLTTPDSYDAHVPIE